MCGISGYFGHFDPKLLHDMTDAMAHRGPDGCGIWADEQAHIGLAHRRLSILDLSNAASQPMQAVEGRYIIVFNGEIYNFKELYNELKDDYTLNPHSDTSVICPLYDKLGPDMLHKLNGMFAFAIWDKQERSLFIARDHLGVKPVYYTQTREGGLVFASEIKTLLAAPHVDRSLNPDAIADYLTYIWSPGENTPFKAVKKLNPGHALFVKDFKKPRMYRWYTPPLPGKKQVDNSKKSSDLQELLDKVVKDQCVSDVPVGAFLSGGVDSSAIVASMVEQKMPPAKSYCMTFHGSSMKDEGFSDDISFAREISKYLGISLTEVEASPEGMDRLPELVRILEEPLADPAPMYVQDICAAARADGIKVLMSGTGGDDVFAGYRRHQAAVLREHFGSFSSVVGFGASAAASLTAGSLKRRLQRLGYMLQGDENTFLHKVFEFSPRQTALNLLSDDTTINLSPKHENALKNALEQSFGVSPLNRLLFMELHGFLPDHNLTYTDKAAMHEGLEVRVPLIDTRLLDFAQTLPQHQKIHRGRTKVMLKDAIANRLPAGILDRPKAGFGAPIRHWICNERADMVEDILFGDTSRQRGIFDLDTARTLYTQTQTGRVDGAYTILSMLMIELWCQEFVDKVN